MTDEDDRGLPESVVKFAETSIHFKNVITSAPSTVQSISSMMTSSPSYLLSRSYNNYRGKLDCFDYFPTLLREEGYKIFGAIYFKHGREVMSDMFGMIEKKYFPKNLSHRKEVWTNMDVHNLFSNIVDQHDWTKPTMCYLHYNVRIDTNISTVVESTLALIRDKGLMEQSVVLINSDHGYPAASKNYNFEQGLKEGWGHDKYLTNDNILTPLVLHYPGVVPEKIEEYVATIDIVPTLCQLLDVEPSKKFQGQNILGERKSLSNRLIRTDNRYVGQLPSYASYIKNQQKAIIYKDWNQTEEVNFYDLNEDPEEQWAKDNPVGFESFYAEFKANEAALNKFHEDYLFQKWSVLGKSLAVKDIRSTCLVLKSTPAFRGIAQTAFQRILPETELFFHDDPAIPEIVDLKIYIIESEIPWDFAPFSKIGDAVPANQIIHVDNNGRIFGKNVKYQLYRSFIGKRYGLIKHDKMFLLDLGKRMISKRLLKPIK